MRHFYRFIIIPLLLFSSSCYAVSFFLEGIEWRATETNDWCYVNSETVPNQTLDYKTIDFSYRPGFRIGAFYVNQCDTLISYTHFYTSTHDSATGHIQPGFLGSVTAKPSHAYLYDSGHVKQTINYNMFDLDIGKQFYPTQFIMLHPIIGLMGGWIDQAIQAQYFGSTSSSEHLTNDFKGVGPKMGIDVDVSLCHFQNYQPKFFVSFATSYLLGHWDISDVTHVVPTRTVFVEGANHNMGAFTLQSAIGLKLDYKQFAFKLVYEMSDWFDQCQFFDNDTGAHNNDLVLQGLTLGIAYNLN